MRNLSKLALAGVLAAGLAGTAVAGARSVHVMNVPLPDGTVARVQYVGDVAPRVTIVPVVPAGVPGAGVPVGFALPDLEGAFAQMDRQMAAMRQQIDALSRQSAAVSPGGASLAAFGGAVPAGTTSYSSVTVSENGHQCSRSTSVIGQGPGKPPKVSSTVSGDCGPAARGAAPRSPAPQGAPAAAIPDGPVYQS